MNMRRHILLIEALQIQQMLLESRIDFLKQTFFPRIQQMLAAGTLVIPPNISHVLARQEGDDDAEKLFNLVLASDPDLVKKNSQWLFTQCLRKTGAMPLEDLEGASETLAQYAEMKRLRQIPPDKADINAFKSLSELYQVVRGEVEQQVVAADAEQAEMLKESKVLLNNSEVLVLVPETKKAACYWGQPTSWCTAWGDHKALGLKHQGQFPTRTNQFDYYHSQGPLYIVIEKATDTHWQLNFESRQFMDKNDHAFSVPDLVKKYPAVAKVIGEEKFAQWASELGLSWFSQEAIAKFPDNELAKYVRSKADLKKIPFDKINNPQFAVALMRNIETRHTSARESVIEGYDGAAVNWFPSKFVLHHAYELATEFPPCFKHLPPDLQTQDLANDVAEALKSATSAKLTVNVPKHFWTPEITAQYWAMRAREDPRSIHLKDIPEEFQNKESIISCLAYHPTEIPDFPKLLNKDIALAIAMKNIEAIKYLPEHFLDKDMADLLQSKITGDRHRGIQGYGYGITDPKSLWGRFESQYWTKDIGKWLIENGKVKFNKLPENLRTEDNIVTLLNKDATQAKIIPEQYWTRELLRRVVQPHSAVLKNINPAYVPEDFLVGLASMDAYSTNEDGIHIYRGSYNAHFYDYNLPDSMKTPNVVKAFVDAGVVSLDKVPHDLITPENILKRIKDHPAELEDVPHEMITPEFAIKLVETNKDTINNIPESSFSKQLLIDWEQKVLDYYNIESNGYHDPASRLKPTFDRFPQSMWTSESIAKAVDLGFILPTRKAIPAGMMTRDIAGAIIAKNADEVHDLDQLDDNAIALAMGHNWRLLHKLSPEKITEPMTFNVMQKFASIAKKVNFHGDFFRSEPTYYHTEDKNKQSLRTTLLEIPKKVWSKRVCNEAVGNIISLKQVPAKWQDEKMIKNALERDPINVRFIKDPAAFLNAHLAGYGTDGWRQGLEMNGVGILRKKFFNIASLERKPLKTGGSVAQVIIGKSNIRLYLFDKKGKYILFMYTHKDTVCMAPEDVKKAQDYKADILEIARSYLSGFQMGILNELGIYGKYNNIYTEEQSPKRTMGSMEWSNNSHGSGSMIVGYRKGAGAKSATKPVIRIQTETGSGGWGRSGKTSITRVEIYDVPYAIEHSQDITSYMNRYVNASGGWDQFPKIGIYFNKNGEAMSIAEKKIGTYGDLTIWRNLNNPSHIGLFGPNGMIGRGIVRANGSITKVEKAEGRYSQSGVSTEALARMFGKISDILMKNKNASGISISETLHRIGKRL